MKCRQGINKTKIHYKILKELIILRAIEKTMFSAFTFSSNNGFWGYSHVNLSDIS